MALFRRSVELFFLFLVACSPYRELPEIERPSFRETGIQKPFEEVEDVVVYKTRAEVYERSFSGLLYVKPTGERSYRTVFTSEMGMSFFDLAFDGKSFEVKQCFEKFDRRAVLSRIRQDMRLLLMCTIEEDDKGELLRGQEGERIWKAPKGEDGTFYYHLLDGELAKASVVKGWNRKKKLILHYSDFEEAVPGELRFEHRDIELSMEMERVR